MISGQARSQIAIYGAGGCGRDILTAVLRSCAAEKIFFVDDERAGQTVMGIPVLAPQELETRCSIIIAIGDGDTRRRIESQLNDVASFTAGTALVSEHSLLGPGAVLSDHVLIGPEVTIGRQFQANYFSYVSHDCVIGDYVTFAPRVGCNGNVTIGNHAYIGANATLLQGVKIGARAVVGMGAVVVKDVPAGATVVGNPARTIKTGIVER